MKATLLIEFTKDNIIYNYTYAIRGVLTKMQTELGNPIQYYLVLKIVFKCESIIDKNLKLILWDTNVFEKKEKIFRQGFCYDCFYSSAAVGDWIMKPELSTAHWGFRTEIWSMRKSATALILFTSSLVAK
jgi:hypothetical protein